MCRTDPSTGMPGAQLGACTSSTVFTLSGSQLQWGGDCLDITSHTTAQCASVEAYGCNGGSNQVA